MKRFLPILILSATALAQTPPEPSRAAWRELFAQSQPARATSQLSAVLAACGNKLDTLKALIAADAEYGTYPPGWGKASVRVADGATAYDVEFFYRVPAGYTPAKAWPVVVGAHGQHAEGMHMGRTMELLLGADREKYILIAPTMPGPDTFNGKGYQEQAHLQPLAWAQQHLRVDANRVYLTGYSQGGHLSWHMATMFPRLFAAAVPMAGVPWFEGSPYVNDIYLENLSNLPVWAVWGAQDKAAPGMLGNVDFSRLAAARLAELKNDKFKGTELANAAHGECFPPAREFGKFLASTQRSAAPEKFAHLFHMPQHARGYYLEATKFAHEPMDLAKTNQIRVVVPAGQTPTSQAAHDAIVAALRRQMFGLWGELDKPANTLSIRALGVLSVRVYVTEGMFDLSQPVTIKWASTTWKQAVPASPRSVLEHYAATRDASALIYNEIDMDISGRAVVKYKE